MQLACVDHVEALDGFKARHYLLLERLHQTRGALVAGEVQIEALAHEAVRQPSEAVERVLDAAAEELLAEHPVVYGHAQLELCAVTQAVPELKIIFPAGE